jgi:hypothetical protein
MWYHSCRQSHQYNLQLTSISVANERYLKHFVEIILKIKILNLSNLFGPLQYGSVQSILKEYKYKPYVPRKIHTIEENDPERRAHFCLFF